MCIPFNRLGMSLNLWLIFPNRNYKSRSIEDNFNWCWHHTLHFKKIFPIFENFLKTSGTTSKVLSCLKIPLTSMHVDHFESCETILDRFQTPSIFSHSWLVPKSPGRNSSTASAEKFHYSFYYNERLENKLTRGPLLGLAKYIYLYIYLS